MNSKYIKFIAFIIAVLILGLFFSSDLVFVKNFLYRAFSPISKRIILSSDNVREFFVSIKEIGRLSKDNAKLETENNLLKSQIASLEETEHENEILKKELGFLEGNVNREMIPSRIINRSPTSFFQNVRIDKGTFDGVEKGKAVLSEGFLIGIITEVGNNYSDVSLITNNRSLISVVLQESRGTGLLRGGLKGMTIEEVPLDSPIIRGERVVTSGLGDNLPSGIIIGTIQEIISSKSEIFQRGTIKSPIEFGKLEFVFVLK